MEPQRKGTTSLTLQILRKYESLTQYERKVADMVLALKEGLIGHSISSLAAACGVSEPTVIRFCKSLGYGGIKELKRAAVQPEVPSSALSGKITDFWEIRSEEEMVSFVFNNIVDVLRETQKLIDAPNLNRAVGILSGAKYVKVVGFGGSSIIARHAQHYLRMLGMHVDMVNHYLPNDPLAENYHEGDVVLAISFSGNTSMVVDIVEDAKRKGAAVIGLTAWGENKIHALSDVSLQSIYGGKGIIPGIHAIERMALLALVDVLLCGVSLCKAAPL